ncbi:hypothetical protein EAF00_009333 [Botryotinia globosa]|nr:hypothetical protein EAF00_009333 [Botryotinia globosa]
MAPSAIHNGALSPLRNRQSSNGNQLSKLNGYNDFMLSPSLGQRSMDGSDYFPTPLLQDTTQKIINMYRSELGHSSDKFLQSCKSVESFFDCVATIGLSQMPHHGSRWDKILKWAEFFTGQVSTYSEEVSSFTTQSEQATNIIYASCKMLLEMGPKFVPILEKIFGVLYNCSITLGFLVRHHELLHTIEELQTVLVACYADLLKLLTGVTIYLHEKTTRQACFKYDSMEAVRNFLTPHDRVTRILATNHRAHGARADFTCEWLDRPLRDFARSGKNIFMVTGSAGSGKYVLSEWVVERLHAFKDGTLKTELSTLSIVKGLLLQMLQLSAGDKALYKELFHAYELYKGIQAPRWRTHCGPHWARVFEPTGTRQLKLMDLIKSMVVRVMDWFYLRDCALLFPSTRTRNALSSLDHSLSQSPETVLISQSAFKIPVKVFNTLSNRSCYRQ